MKKLTKVLSLLLAGSVLFAMTACGNKSTDQSELIMATEAGFAPYEYYEGQEIVGVDIDIAKEIAKDMNKKLVVKDIAFDAIINEIQTGKADFGAAGMTITSERQKEVDFTIEYATSKQVVMVKDTDSKLQSVNDVTTKEGLKIGVQLGTTADLDEIIEEFYHPSAQIVQQKKYLALVEDLKAGKIDCIVMDSNPAENIIANNSGLKILEGELFTDKYGMAVKKGNTELLESINKTLQRLIDEGKIVEYTVNHISK